MRKMRKMRKKTKEKAIQSEYPALRPCGETEIGNLIERHAQPVRYSKGSPSEPFPSTTRAVRQFGSRLRGRAVQTGVPRLERVWGVLFLHSLSPNQKWSLLTIREKEYPSRLSDGCSRPKI